LVYFYLGRLPWQNKTDKGKPLTQKITEKKLTTPPELLCKKMPREFSYYFHYCKNLKFEDRPDYNSLKCMFAELLSSRMKIHNIKELVYDWFDEENTYRERKKKEMISSSNNKSEINKVDEELLQNKGLNKIEEKEDGKEESIRTGSIGHDSKKIEEEKGEEGDENSNNSKKRKSSISSASDDKDIKNNENEEKKEEENNVEVVEEKSDIKSSNSYGLLDDDKKKANKEENNSKDKDN
jgi:hypothetical protein